MSSSARKALRRLSSGYHNLRNDEPDYTKKRTWQDGFYAPNIGPVMWWEHDPKPEDYLSGIHDPMFQSAQDRVSIERTLIAEFHDYAEAVEKLKLAEAHYQTVKNMKKSNPPKFYEGRDKLYRARAAVAGFEMPDMSDIRRRRDALSLERYTVRRQAERNAFYMPQAFRAWLRRQVNDHFQAKHKPELVIGEPDKVYPALLPGKATTPRTEIEGRYAAYSRLWMIYREQGILAAIEEHERRTEPLLARLAVTEEDGTLDEYINEDGKEKERWLSWERPVLPTVLRFPPPPLTPEERAKVEAAEANERRSLDRLLKKEVRRARIRSSKPSRPNKPKD